MAFPGNNYAPPGVYTQTLFEAPTAASLDSLKIPVFIGEGNEYLIQQQLEVVRGSSATADQRIVSEDETNRMVVSINGSGAFGQKVMQSYRQFALQELESYTNNLKDDRC